MDRRPVDLQDFIAHMDGVLHIRADAVSIHSGRETEGWSERVKE